MEEMSPLRGRKVPLRPTSSLLVKSPKGRYHRRPIHFYASSAAKTRTEASPVPGLSPCPRKEPVSFRAFHTLGDGQWKYQSRKRRYLSVTVQESLVIKGTSPMRIKTVKCLDVRESLPSIRPGKRGFPSVKQMAHRPLTSDFAPQLHLLSVLADADSDQDLSAWT